MQNYNKYLRPLQHELIHDGNPTAATIERVYQFISGIQDLPINKGKLSYKPYHMLYGKAFVGNIYHDMLFDISKMMDVKIMWRWLLREKDGMAIKGVWIIGVGDKVQIAHAFMEWFFGLYWNYYFEICKNAQEEAKRASYSSVRSYASQLVSIYMHDIAYAMFFKLEVNNKYDLWLNKMIKEMFRLDYKEYKGRKEYYHAISFKFHHRRMIS